MRTYIPVLVLLLSAGVASAQVAELGAFGGAHLVRNGDLGTFSGVETSLDDGWQLGFRLTLNSYRFFGHELGYGYNRTTMKFGSGSGAAEQGTAIHRGFYSFLAYATPEGSVIRPFAAGGGHFANYAYPGLSATSGGGSTKWGIHYGGGIKVRVTPIFGIRFDLRDYWNPKPFGSFGFENQDGWIHHVQLSAGFSLLM